MLGNLFLGQLELSLLASLACFSIRCTQFLCDLWITFVEVVVVHGGVSLNGGVAFLRKKSKSALSQQMQRALAWHQTEFSLMRITRLVHLQVFFVRFVDEVLVLDWHFVAWFVFARIFRFLWSSYFNCFFSEYLLRGGKEWNDNSIWLKRVLFHLGRWFLDKCGKWVGDVRHQWV